MPADTVLPANCRKTQLESSHSYFRVIEDAGFRVEARSLAQYDATSWRRLFAPTGWARPVDSSRTVPCRAAAVLLTLLAHLCLRFLLIAAIIQVG